MYFRRQSTHAVPALKLCRSPCIWQMIKTVFLGITSSHPCFLVQCESFPSCQCCYSGLSALFFEGFPQLSSLKTPVFCGISFACRPRCVGFVQILNVDLAQEPCIDYFWLVLHSQAIFTFSPLLFFMQLFMQIEALFPRRFGTWSEYARKYCDARVRYYCPCLFTFLWVSLIFLIMPRERISR